MGDVVEVDGIPMGCTLINVKVLKVLYDMSPEYQAGNLTLREIFITPRKVWFSPEERNWFTSSGTEDLAWCTKVMEEDVFRKAGFEEFADKEFPFIIDTNVFCRHIDMDGVQFPARGEEQQFQKEEVK